MIQAVWRVLGRLTTKKAWENAGIIAAFLATTLVIGGIMLASLWVVAAAVYATGMPGTIISAILGLVVALGLAGAIIAELDDA